MCRSVPCRAKRDTWSEQQKQEPSGNASRSRSEVTVHTNMAPSSGNLSCLCQWWLLPLMLFVIVASPAAANPDAKRLYDDLLSNYNKLVRPVVNTTDVLKVCIKLRLSQLIDVVSTRLTLDTCGTSPRANDDGDGNVIMCVQSEWKGGHEWRIVWPWW